MVEKVEKTEKGFRKLLVWQRAHQLVLSIYKLTETFPKSELFGLTSQMRRAAVSVPANIAEGYAAGGKGQFARYLNIAQGSLAEVEYYLILTHDLKWVCFK
ncbi:MAG: four helix bundle protein [Anaerolineales bacterium]|nr:four helix bundle protein [Anaerolineales bacterium]